jgi:hypothetical protein
MRDLPSLMRPIQRDPRSSLRLSGKTGRRCVLFLRAVGIILARNAIARTRDAQRMANAPPHGGGLVLLDYQRAVIVGQCVRGGGSGGGLVRLWVMMAAAMASKEALTCVPHLPAIRLGPSGAMMMP